MAVYIKNNITILAAFL